jgi:hypothetical protein
MGSILAKGILLECASASQEAHSPLPQQSIKVVRRYEYKVAPVATSGSRTSMKEKMNPAEEYHIAIPSGARLAKNPAKPNYTH